MSEIKPTGWVAIAALIIVPIAIAILNNLDKIFPTPNPPMAMDSVRTDNKTSSLEDKNPQDKRKVTPQISTSINVIKQLTLETFKQTFNKNDINPIDGKNSSEIGDDEIVTPTLTITLRKEHGSKPSKNLQWLVTLDVRGGPAWFSRIWEIQAGRADEGYIIKEIIPSSGENIVDGEIILFNKQECLIPVGQESCTYKSKYGDFIVRGNKKNAEDTDFAGIKFIPNGTEVKIEQYKEN